MNLDKRHRHHAVSCEFPVTIVTATFQRLKFSQKWILHCLPAVGIRRTHRGSIELGQGIPIPGQKSSMSQAESLETKDTLEEKAHTNCLGRTGWKWKG